MAHSRDVSYRAGTQLAPSSCRYRCPPRDANKCHSCCMWTRVLWQVARQRSDGDQLVVAGLGQLVMGVTFIPLFYGRAPLVVTEREVLALFCTPTPLRAIGTPVPGETRNRASHYGGSPLILLNKEFVSIRQGARWATWTAARE